MQYEVPDAGHIGLDVFNTSALRAGAIVTMKLGNISLAGPQNLTLVCYGEGSGVRLAELS